MMKATTPAKTNSGRLDRRQALLLNRDLIFLSLHSPLSAGFTARTWREKHRSEASPKGTIYRSRIDPDSVSLIIRQFSKNRRHDASRFAIHSRAVSD